MGEEPDGDLLIRALATYEGVVGDPKRFGPIASELVHAARKHRDVESLIVALRATAWFERSRLANSRAKELLDEAAGLARRAGLKQRLSEVLVTRAAVNLELGRVGPASQDLDRADSLVDGSAAPDLEMKRAVLLHNLGRLSDAAEVYRRVLDHPGASADNRGSAANNLALIESTRGRLTESLRYLDHAAELAVEVGPSLFAFVAHNRGLVLAQSGRLAESLRQFDEATIRYREADLPLEEHEHYIEYADALADLRLLPEARMMSLRAARQLEDHRVLLMAAEARLTVAQTALLAGDHSAALEAAHLAVAQFRKQRRTAWVARATVVAAEASYRGGSASAEQLSRTRRAAGVLDRLGMPAAAVEAHLACGRIAAALGRRAIARRSLRMAQDRSRHGPVLVRLKGQLAAALAERLDDRDRAVLSHCRSGLADLAAHRAALASMELRALASGHGAELGQLGLEVLLRTGSPARVLDWMERTRAAALLTVEPPAHEAVREELTELAAVHAELSQARRESGAEPAELLSKQAAAEERVRRATWQRRGSGAPSASTVPLGDVRALLAGRVLVSYGRHGGELFAVVVELRRSRLVWLGAFDAVRFEGDALSFALRRLTRRGSPAALDGARASAEHALSRLAELLVRPLGLVVDAPLVVIPHSQMNRIPWSALHSAPVSVAPSASVWARTRRPTSQAVENVVLVAGPGLPGAVEEITAVAGLHERPTVLVPPASTTAAVVEALGTAGLAHLACHGHLRADNPTFSALQLTDGPLTVHELDLRGIAPRRMILAACDSAADVSYDGDELLGFVSALLARGTAGLVASVVAVGDAEAVPLMRGLHERLLRGDLLAEALHGTRAALDRTDPRMFVNWCAFTAYGAG